MKPFKDLAQFEQIGTLPSTGPAFSPDKSGYGVEIRRGRDINKRKNSIFISSGRWAEMGHDGLIDQEQPPLVIGELIDPLRYSAYTDQDQRKTAEQILESGEIIVGQTIDYDPMTDKDGRITVFDIRPRGYVVNEEIPHKTRGIKVTSDSITGIGEGILYNPFLDGGNSELGISREGLYGSRPEVRMPFIDRDIITGLGTQIDTGDFDSESKTGAFGTVLYSSEFGTDSIAFAGLKK
jgi:hypothetical protein